MKLRTVAAAAFATLLPAASMAQPMGNVFEDIRNSGIADFQQTIQPDGDARLDIYFDRIETLETLKQLHGMIPVMAVVNPQAVGFIQSLTEIYESTCERGEISTDNPVGKMQRAMISSLFSQLGVSITPDMRQQLEESTSEQNMREEAATQGSPYISTVTLHCTMGA